MSYDSVVLADSPISYWKLNDLSGTTAVDSADSNNGTYSGGFTLNTSKSPTQLDGAVAFATNGVVTVSDATNLHLTSPFSLEAWVKVSSSTTHTFFSHYAATTPFAGYALSILSGKAAIWVGDLSGSWFTGNKTLSDGFWHHVVGTLSGTTVSLYVDGVLDATGTRTPSLSNTNNLYIARAGDVADFLTGTLSSIAIYNTALTTQIATHFTAGINPILLTQEPVEILQDYPPPANRISQNVLEVLQIYSLSYGIPPNKKKPNSYTLNNPYRQNLVAGFPFINNTAKDILNHHNGSLIGGATWSQSDFGLSLKAVDTGGSGAGISLGAVTELPGTTAFTFSSLCTLDTLTDAPAAANYRYLFGHDRSGAGGPITALSFNASNLSLNFYYGYANRLSVPIFPINIPVLVTVTLTTAGVCSIWYNDIKVGTASPGALSYPVDYDASAGAGNYPGIGISALIPSRNWSGLIINALVATRAFSNSEIYALVNDPFIWHRPLRLFSPLDTLVGLLPSINNNLGLSGGFTPMRAGFRD